MTTPVVTVARTRRSAGGRPGARSRVGAVPVTDDFGLVLGIVCEHDLLAKKASPERRPAAGPARHRREQGKAAAATAASLMTSPAVTTRAQARTEEAARLMYRNRIGSLPVVDSLGRLIGIVGRGDVLDGFTRPDAEIRGEVVQDVISRDFLLDPEAFLGHGPGRHRDAVRAPESDQVGHLLAAAVRRVEGVVGLRDQLRYTAGRRGPGAGSATQLFWPG